MLHILVILLKILGCILLFLLALLLLILFTPFRYQFELKKEVETPLWGQARITWFLRAVVFSVAYINQALEYRLKIFGFQVLGNDPEFLEAKEEKRKRKAKKEAEKSKKKAGSDLKEKEELSAASLEEKARKEEAPEEEAPEKEVPKEKASSNKSKGGSGNGKKTRKGLSDINPGRKLTGAMEKLKGLRSSYEEYHLGPVISRLWQAVRKLLSHILPRKLKGWMRFGFDDPAVTGYVTAFAASFYPLYGKRFRLQPDFQEKCFEADCHGKGLVRPVFLLYLIVWLLLDKNIRDLIKVWRNK
ncbi:MAG: DUF2953 domain-containing protein [Eubacterium sp.]|nr:DUF2953 domain-containing protein [Eubacterium sp.]